MSRLVAALQCLEAIVGVSCFVYSGFLILELLGWYHEWGAYTTIVLIYNVQTIIVTISLILGIGILNLIISSGLVAKETHDVASLALIMSIFVSGLIIYLSPDWKGIYLPTSEIEHYYNPSLLSLHGFLLGSTIIVNAVSFLYLLMTSE
jgi:hypothetical protein